MAAAAPPGPPGPGHEWREFLRNMARPRFIVPALATVAGAAGLYFSGASHAVLDGIANYFRASPSSNLSGVRDATQFYWDYREWINAAADAGLSYGILGTRARRWF